VNKKDKAAWAIAIGGVTLEIFIATLDYWFEIPHFIIVKKEG
jgi:hypothetical protein